MRAVASAACATPPQRVKSTASERQTVDIKNLPRAFLAPTRAHADPQPSWRGASLPTAPWRPGGEADVRRPLASRNASSTTRGTNPAISGAQRFHNVFETDRDPTPTYPRPHDEAAMC